MAKPGLREDRRASQQDVHTTWMVVVWALLNVLLVCYIGLSWKVSKVFLDECEENKLCTKTSRSAGFRALWMLLLAAGMTMGGTLALTRARTTFAVGTLAGLCVGMSNWFLVLAVDHANMVVEKKGFIDRVGNVDVTLTVVHFRQLIEATAALAVLLTILFALLAALLSYFANDLTLADDRVLEQEQAMDAEAAVPVELTGSQRALAIVQRSKRDKEEELQLQLHQQPRASCEAVAHV